MKFYVDTSVWGGFEDKEFSEWTIPFFAQARQGKFTIVLSDVTIGELEKAPELIRELPTTIPPDFLELVSITDEHLELANKYPGWRPARRPSDRLSEGLRQRLGEESMVRDGLVSWLDVTDSGAIVGCV